MTHDELRDFIDYVEFGYLASHVPIKNDERDKFKKNVRTRRAGLGSGFPDEMLQPNAKHLTMTTPLQKQAIEHIHKASKKDLEIIFGKASLQRDISGAIAWVLLRTKAPIRKTSQGNIQVKFIPYKQLITKIDEKTGLEVPALDENGNRQYREIKAPYLYLRYWQVLGDKGKKSRVKSIYIGGETPLSERGKGGYIYRDLAYNLYDLLQKHGDTRTRTIKATGEIQTYKVRPSNDDNPIAELENKIMDCIDMSQVDSEGKNAINHECLEELQASISL